MAPPREVHVRGLDCAEEMEALRQTVGRLPGVAELEFNLLQGTMLVTAGPEVTDDDIAAAVQRAGLAVVPSAEPGAAADVESHPRLPIVLCCVSAALTLAGLWLHGALHGGLVHAFAERERQAQSLPVPVLLLYAAAVLSGGWTTFPKAWRSLVARRPDMYLLMCVAVVGAMAIGEWFEAATVIFLFALAQLLESWTVVRARRAIQALLAVAPPTARYRGPHHGEILEKPVGEVPVGVVALVRPGERVALDGVVCEGETTVNEAPITGESRPVPKQPGALVFAGSINHDGAFAFTVTRPAADTTLAHIRRLVRAAHARRARSEQWIDRVAAVYTPTMLGLAAAVAVVPPLLGGGGWVHWLYRALVLLVIACPCALVISTPVAIVAGLTAAARRGVLVKGGVFLEAAATLRAFALDKTGTLTCGEPEVSLVLPWQGHTEEELLARAMALEAESDHPLARAILRYGRARGVTPLAIRERLALPGRGVQGRLGERLCWAGSHRLADDRRVEHAEMHDVIADIERAGQSSIIIGSDRHVCGVIAVTDAVRPAAAAAVRELQRLGLAPVCLLTGDNEATARRVAAMVGIDECHAGLLPADKVRVVADLLRRHGQVGMVGDGINDAPALATATLGIAMAAAGTDAAIETADVALMNDDLARLPWLVRHARRTRAIIHANVGFAVGLKALFILLTLTGFASLWAAIAADTGASLLVIGNSLRLLRSERPSP
jgi:Zn2+/Cd2+-exporting ATPase